MAGSGGTLVGGIFGSAGGLAPDGTRTAGAPFHNTAGFTVGIPYKTFQNLPAENDWTTATFKPTLPNTGEGTGVGRVFFKDNLNAWVYTYRTKSLHRIRDENYPANTVPGQAYLNGRIYVLTPQGKIYGSAINDPYSWSELDTIFAHGDPDIGMAIIQFKGYVITWGAESMQVFYDSGAPVGNPLRRVDHAFANVGCWNGYSLQNLGNSLYFGSFNKASGRGVSRLTGLEVEKVSTPFVDRILDSSREGSGEGARVETNGHSFYLINVFCLNHTLVYDSTTNLWHVWGGPDLFNDNLYVGDGTWTAAVDTETGYVKLTVEPFVGSTYTDLPAVGMAVKILLIEDAQYLGEHTVHKVVTDLSATLGYRLEIVVPNATLGATTSGVIHLHTVHRDKLAGWFAQRTAEFQSEVVNASGLNRGPTHLGIIDGRYKVYEIQQVFADDGKEYSWLPSVNPEAGTFHLPIPTYVRTARLDHGTNIKKFISRLEIIGDNAPVNVYVRYSDDDGNTMSTWRKVSMSLLRPRLTRLGSSRRRIWEIMWYTAAHLRVESLEVFGWMGNRS